MSFCGVETFPAIAMHTLREPELRDLVIVGDVNRLAALIHAQNQSLRCIRLSRCDCDFGSSTAAAMSTPASLAIALVSCTELTHLVHIQTNFKLLEPTNLSTKLVEACFDWPTCTPADASTFIRQRRQLRQFELHHSSSLDDTEGWLQVDQDALSAGVDFLLRWESGP